MPDALTTLTSVCLSGLLSGTLIWLTKSWISERLKNAIEHEYNEKLETHKARLRSESDIAIERLKSLFQIAASERNVRYSRVFERTAESVAQIYAKLLAFLDAVEHYTTTIEWANDPPKAERRKVVAEKYQQFLDYYRPRRLFLPRTTANRIEGFCKQLYRTAVGFMFGVEQGRDLQLRKSDPDKDTWLETDKFMREQVPPLLDLLEDDFRNILGTIDDQKKPLSQG